MQGVTMDELYELVSHYHDAEFEYNGTTYILQPELKNGKEYLVIWDITPDKAKCICRHDILLDGNDISRETIDAVLSEKCFDGRSFLEIERDITVTVIF